MMHSIQSMDSSFTRSTRCGITAAELSSRIRDEIRAILLRFPFSSDQGSSAALQLHLDDNIVLHPDAWEPTASSRFKFSNSNHSAGNE
jgi:hypothetical protein